MSSLIIFQLFILLEDLLNFQDKASIADRFWFAVQTIVQLINNEILAGNFLQIIARPWLLAIIIGRKYNADTSSSEHKHIIAANLSAFSSGPVNVSIS